MDFYLLGETLSVVAAVPHIISARVTRRFFAPGEIEITTSVPVRLPSSAVYVFDAERDVCAVIERVERLPDGRGVIFGRSAECLLERRVIRLGGAYNGSVAGALGMVLGKYVTGGAAPLPVKLGKTEGLPSSASLRFDFDTVSNWLYTTLARYGASYTLSASDTDGVFVFDTLCGRDLAPSDSELGVRIRESDGTLEDVSLSVDERGMSNVLYVAGSDGRYAEYPASSDVLGIRRREAFLKARDVSPSDYSTDEAYFEALRKRGEEKLSAYRERINFTGSACGGRYHRFGIDYDLGDLCELELTDGEILKLRVTAVQYTLEGGSTLTKVGFGGDIDSSAVKSLSFAEN